MLAAMSCLACCRRPEQPAVDERMRLRQRLVEAAILALHVHQHEARRVPQLVAEVAIALAAVQVEVERAVERRERREREAHGVGAECRDAVGKTLARALRDPLRLARVHHVAGRLGHERLGVDAVDEVDRIEHVPLRLRHLVAFLVAHDRVDVHVAERHVAGEIGRRHDHARDPEEDDVEAGDEHRRGQERRELLRLLGPPERGVAPQRRAEPRVEHVGIARRTTAGSRPSFARACARASASLRATYTLPASSYHAGIWWPHQSWREMHQSWMLLIQCR